jgi:hypothetical protein
MNGFKKTMKSKKVIPPDDSQTNQESECRVLTTGEDDLNCRTRNEETTNNMITTLIEHNFRGSSAISSFRWVASRTDHTVGNMTVTFTDGNRYMYRNVNKTTARNWMRVQSAGGYFQRHLKPLRSERV